MNAPPLDRSEVLNVRAKCVAVPDLGGVQLTGRMDVIGSQHSAEGLTA